MKINVGLAATVTATDRWLSELRLGRAFGATMSVGPVAGQLPHVQLFNPVGSGVTVLVHYMAFVTTGIHSGALSHHNVALTTLGANIRNLLSGGPAPQAQIRAETNVAALGNTYLGGDTNVPIDFVYGPMWLTELDPGEGIVGRDTVANRQLRGAFMWIELPQ